MKQFESLHTIISKLNELTNRLSTSKLSIEELEEFENTSRALYERTIILHYKAKEEKVYGKEEASDESPKENSSEEENKSLPIYKENIDHSEEESNDTIEEHIEVPEVQEKPETNKSLEISFDFSESFDAFSQESASKKETDMVAEDNLAEDNNSEISDKENENLSKKSEETLFPIDSLLGEHEEGEHEEVDNTNDSSTNIDSTIFMSHFSKVFEDAKSNKLGNAKIDSLLGAFGLNERLLFINELFEGDSGAFNKTIEVLDQLENQNTALKKLSEIAVQNNWDKNTSSVDEFAHLVNRRYVD